MNSRRKWDLYNDIIKAAVRLGSPARVRDVLKAANIQFSRGDPYLEKLETAGLIKLNEPSFDQQLVLTHKAYRFAEYYRELKVILNEKV